jgi:hypothetical protein
MWAKLVKDLAHYPKAVLNVVDADGYPFSVRVSFEVDNSAQVLWLDIPVSASVQAGPASLLCHYHDEFLWNQTNFVVRGTLENRGHEWRFIPASVTPGAGKSMNTFKLLINGRRTADAYLKKRNLPRPQIPWDQLAAVKNSVK